MKVRILFGVNEHYVKGNIFRSKLNYYENHRVVDTSTLPWNIYTKEHYRNDETKGTTRLPCYWFSYFVWDSFRHSRNLTIRNEIFVETWGCEGRSPSPWTSHLPKRKYNQWEKGMENIPITLTIRENFREHN